MYEYGRTTASTTGVGNSGGNRDITGDVYDMVVGAVDQVASLPPEMLITGAIVAVIGFILIRR